MIMTDIAIVKANVLTKLQKMTINKETGEPEYELTDEGEEALKELGWTDEDFKNKD